MVNPEDVVGPVKEGSPLPLPMIGPELKPGILLLYFMPTCKIKNSSRVPVARCSRLLLASLVCMTVVIGAEM